MLSNEITGDGGSDYNHLFSVIVVVVVEAVVVAVVLVVVAAVVVSCNLHYQQQQSSMKCCFYHQDCMLIIRFVIRIVSECQILSSGLYHYYQICHQDCIINVRFCHQDCIIIIGFCHQDCILIIRFVNRIVLLLSCLGRPSPTRRVPWWRIGVRPSVMEVSCEISQVCLVE